MSPGTTGIVASSAFFRNCAIIAVDISMPVTAIPLSLSGTATRPVPIANSSARPPAASSASRSTAGPNTSAENIPAPGVS